jgi:hypothetical protein
MRAYFCIVLAVMLLAVVMFQCHQEELVQVRDAYQRHTVVDLGEK